MAKTDNGAASTLSRELPAGEFLPLPVAASVAYYQMTPSRRRLADEHAAEMVHLAAIALSTVAPIYMATGGGTGAFVLSSGEVEELLFRPLKSRERPDLGSLRIRRADMQRGIETLKASRNAFWNKP